jgi:hypothetical protein
MIGSDGCSGVGVCPDCSGSPTRAPIAASATKMPTPARTNLSVRFPPAFPGLTGGVAVAAGLFVPEPVRGPVRHGSRSCVTLGRKLVLQPRVRGLVKTPPLPRRFGLRPPRPSAEDPRWRFATTVRTDSRVTSHQLLAEAALPVLRDVRQPQPPIVLPRRILPTATVGVNVPRFSVRWSQVSFPVHRRVSIPIVGRYGVRAGSIATRTGSPAKSSSSSDLVVGTYVRDRGGSCSRPLPPGDRAPSTLGR